jgi:hypothetical protein
MRDDAKGRADDAPPVARLAWPFVRHQNLLVLDNGSTDPEVLATLREFAARGVFVDHGHATRDAYLAKGDILGALIREIDAVGQHDILMPLDCDEFVVLKTDSGAIDIARDAILAYLDTLAGERRVLRFPYQLANHPLYPDIYHYFTFFKSFFTAGTFLDMDHGHHVGRSRLAEGHADTRLLHLHFHHKPFDRLLERARLGWIGTVDYNDKAALVNYQGPSMHLAPWFMMSADDYYAGFLNKPHFWLPGFRERLRDLGAPIAMPGGRLPVDGPIREQPDAATVLIPHRHETGIRFTAGLLISIEI